MTDSALRPIRAILVPGIEPGSSDALPPVFRSVAPDLLLVDEGYQRNLSNASIDLIRRIVANWDWRAFKPPIVVELASGLHVLDGQHTAIAAASHPAIAVIPVMVVLAERREDRALAFVRHNRDRIQISATQMHFALMAAGDEEALTVDQVCRRAGARLLKLPPSQGRFAPGDTMAIAAIRTLVRRRHARGARVIVQVCTDALMAPVTASALKAVELLLHEPEYAGEVEADELAATIRRLGDDAEHRAKLFAAEHKVPVWRGLAATLFRNTRKVRRGFRAVG